MEVLQKKMMKKEALHSAFPTQYRGVLATNIFFLTGYKIEAAAVLVHYFPLVGFWHLFSKK
jgi:hypothetical protein